MSSRTINVLWLIAYLATMIGLVTGAVLVRNRTVADLSRPESLAEWKKWKVDTQRQNVDPKSSPVARKPVESDEPPALILLRDYFVAILGVALLVGSFAFGFMMVIVRGVWSAKRTMIEVEPRARPAP